MTRLYSTPAHSSLTIRQFDALFFLAAGRNTTQVPLSSVDARRWIGYTDVHLRRLSSALLIDTSYSRVVRRMWKRHPTYYTS